MRVNRVLGVLAVAVLLGVVATFMVWRALNRPVSLQASEKAPETVQVVAAATDLPVGTLITEDKLKTIPVLASSLPPGAFTDRGQILNRGVVVPMVANEAVLESKLAPEGAGAGLPPVIPEGMRAVSVKVDEVIGVAGFVLPGTRVDVLVTLNPETEGDSQKPAKTRVILQNVQVLASGQKIEKDEEGKPQTVTVITLLVTPEESEKLTLASTEGKIQMALRNAMDMDSVSTEGIQAAELVSEPSRPAPAANAPRRVVAPRPSTQVEVILGDKKTKETF
jgi:pilus assembly protein CpaB